PAAVSAVGGLSLGTGPPAAVSAGAGLLGHDDALERGGDLVGEVVEAARVDGVARAGGEDDERDLVAQEHRQDQDDALDAAEGGEEGGVDGGVGAHRAEVRGAALDDAGEHGWATRGDPDLAHGLDQEVLA